MSSGAEALEQLGGKEEIRGKKTESAFESALAQIAGEIEQAGAGEKSGSPTRTAFQEIAQSADLETPEGALSAVHDSAHFVVKSRLKEDLRESVEGKKVTEDLSSYISKDPFLHKKILNLLQRLK